jgi:hypothetical protein
MEEAEANEGGAEKALHHWKARLFDSVVFAHRKPRPGGAG